MSRAGAASVIRSGVLVLALAGIAPAANAGAAPELEAFGEGVERYFLARDRGAPLRGASVGVEVLGQTRVGLSMISLRDRRSAPDSGGDVKLELAYGGLSISHALLAAGPVSLGLDLLAGGGLRCRRGGRALAGGCPRAEAFGILEGGLDLGVRPVRWLRVGAWLGYRVAVPRAARDADPTRLHEASSPHSADLTGFHGSVQVAVEL